MGGLSATAAHRLRATAAFLPLQGWSFCLKSAAVAGLLLLGSAVPLTRYLTPVTLTLTTLTLSLTTLISPSLGSRGPTVHG